MFCLFRRDWGALTPDVSSVNVYVKSGVKGEPATNRRAMAGTNWNRDWLKNTAWVVKGVGVPTAGTQDVDSRGHVSVTGTLVPDLMRAQGVVGRNQEAVPTAAEDTWNCTACGVGVVLPVMKPLGVAGVPNTRLWAGAEYMTAGGVGGAAMDVPAAFTKSYANTHEGVAVLKAVEGWVTTARLVMTTGSGVAPNSPAAAYSTKYMLGALHWMGASRYAPDAPPNPSTRLMVRNHKMPFSTGVKVAEGFATQPTRSSEPRLAEIKLDETATDSSSDTPLVPVMPVPAPLPTSTHWPALVVGVRVTEPLERAGGAVQPPPAG
jgi:hypothetical protein